MSVDPPTRKDRDIVGAYVDEVGNEWPLGAVSIHMGDETYELGAEWEPDRPPLTREMLRDELARIHDERQEYPTTVVQGLDGEWVDGSTGSPIEPQPDEPALIFELKELAAQGRENRHKAQQALYTKAAGVLGEAMQGAAKATRKLADVTRNFDPKMRAIHRAERGHASHPSRELPEAYRRNRYDVANQVHHIPGRTQAPNPLRGIQPSTKSMPRLSR